MTHRIRVGAVLAAAAPSVFTNSSASYIFALAAAAAVLLVAKSFVDSDHAPP